MSEPAPVYNVQASSNGRTVTKSFSAQSASDLPLKAVKLARRITHLAKEPGEYQFTLIVDENGRWQLRPPAKLEELGL